MEMEQSAFEQLPLARTALPEVTGGQYRVYRDAANFALITAESALQALELSGFGHAYKIQRTSLFMNNLITPQYWEVDPATQPMQADKPVPVQAAEPAAEPALAEAAPPETPTEAPSGEEPLSNQDIDKLLNG